MRQLILEHLQHLVSFDTQNPPRTIQATDPIFEYIRSSLGNEFEFELDDHGKGRVSLLATRGQATTLLNVHLDTVPYGENWKRPPGELTIEKDRAFGRGVCDIKGAAAAMLAATRASGKDGAILFTTDEEGTENCCVDRFCKSNPDRFELAVVAEPTECKAVLEHRGYLSVVGEVHGVAGHTSKPDNIAKSANHEAVNWCAAALGFAQDYETSNDANLCFNIGKLTGGTKNNIVADHATVGWSVRTPCGTLSRDLFENLTRSTMSTATPIDWKISFSAPALPVDIDQKTKAEAFIEDLDLVNGDPVDFWTEAALFSQAGVASIVLGPGNIAQAHAADEWVDIEQLVNAAQLYQRIQEHQ